MKKIFLLFSIIFTLILYICPAQNVRIITETTFSKVGGERNFWGQVRYNSVTKVVDYLQSNTVEGIVIRQVTVTCMGSGDERCSKKLDASLGGIVQLYDNNSIYEQLLIQIEEDLMAEVDAMLDEGSTNGAITRIFILPSIEGNAVFLHHEISWENGNENGDANIRLLIIDMTNQM